jgi:hypothetical protein
MICRASGCAIVATTELNVDSVNTGEVNYDKVFLNGTGEGT